MGRTRHRGRILTVLVSIALIVSACASTQGTSESSTEPQPVSEISIPNSGDATEGHTPIGFAGMGTGLFAGDNLNARFPDGEGVQTYLAFPLPEDVNPLSATLHSEVLQTRGTPFEDLGALTVQRVEYTEFGPQLFDLAASGESLVCTIDGGTAVTCDVTTAVQAAVADGVSSVQFRLRFEQVADNDGQADLAMFYRTDSNTNESGLFVLELVTDDR
jgi:hypothetical protein